MSENGSCLLVLYQEAHELSFLYLKAIPSGSQLVPCLIGKRHDPRFFRECTLHPFVLHLLFQILFHILAQISLVEIVTSVFFSLLVPSKSKPYLAICMPMVPWAYAICQLLYLSEGIMPLKGPWTLPSFHTRTMKERQEQCVGSTPPLSVSLSALHLLLCLLSPVPLDFMFPCMKMLLPEERETWRRENGAHCHLQ